MKKIIFLDIDGVLVTAKHHLYLIGQNLPDRDQYMALFDPECVCQLERIISQTGAKIVLSSSWKRTMNLPSLWAMWKDRKLPGELIDCTPDCGLMKGEEITAWLTECKDHCNYVILDDLSPKHFGESLSKHLITINGLNGITSEDADIAIKILNKT